MMNRHSATLKLTQAQQARSEHIQAWRLSGSTQAAYCQAHGLNAKTFSAWLSQAHARTTHCADAPAPADPPPSSPSPLWPPAQRILSAQPHRAVLTPLTARVVRIAEPSVTPPRPAALVEREPAVDPCPALHSHAPMLVRTPSGVQIELGADTPVETLAALVLALSEHGRPSAQGC